MPGNTFLPIAGPLGTVLGIGIGAVIMLIIAANYHFLMNKYPEAGGAYSYTKYIFGYDHGFLNAWFLILTYVAIIWANATALPLIGRNLLGSFFQFGFHYQIAGFDVYMGEVLLAVAALAIAAAVCLRSRSAGRTQIVLALVLLGGVAACVLAAVLNGGFGEGSLSPAYSPDKEPLAGVFTIIALAPWAYVGFESICHSSEELTFSHKKTFRILAVAVITAGAAYAMLALLAVSVLPEGCASWTDYIFGLSNHQGIEGLPTFFGAKSALGGVGVVLLGLASLAGILTGLIGNYIASSRLLYALAEDNMLPGWFGKLDKHRAPKNAVLFLLAVSVLLPFLGRTAVAWIVDVTTVGATIAYAYTSASALRAARKEKNRLFMVTGGAGLAVSMAFILYFLIPHLLDVTVLSTESYLILAAWGILGFVLQGCRWPAAGPIHLYVDRAAVPHHFYLHRLDASGHRSHHRTGRHPHSDLLYRTAQGGGRGYRLHRHQARAPLPGRTPGGDRPFPHRQQPGANRFDPGRPGHAVLYLFPHAEAGKTAGAGKGAGGGKQPRQNQLPVQHEP